MAKQEYSAALVADDVTRPQMLLTIAFDEMFTGVERMNDLSAEELDTLKASFTDMNDVTFTEAETAAGTKLLVARETGSDEDFASILSLYKGYSVEFVLSPNPNAAEQKLTDETDGRADSGRNRLPEQPGIHSRQLIPGSPSAANHPAGYTRMPRQLQITLPHTVNRRVRCFLRYARGSISIMICRAVSSLISSAKTPGRNSTISPIPFGITKRRRPFRTFLSV